YAKKVIGINSTVLFETLLYHKNIECFGYGLASRRIDSDTERKKYITHCYNKQFYFEDLKNPKIIENSYFYKRMCDKIIK
ncbi:hypothetical protein N9X24_02010, partial [Rickettsiales bacterium]|nr:hypothetical protein [Rickettsiales bacterium]